MIELSVRPNCERSVRPLVSWPVGQLGGRGLYQVLKYLSRHSADGARGRVTSVQFGGGGGGGGTRWLARFRLRQRIGQIDAELQASRVEWLYTARLAFGPQLESVDNEPLLIDEKMLQFLA